MSMIEYKSNPSGFQSKYIYISDEGPIDVHEKSLGSIPKLEIDYKSLGILLDSGVIPTPKSIYKNLLILNAGDSIIYDPVEKKLINHSNFPYARCNSSRVQFKVSQLETNLVEAVKRSLPPFSNSLLFLSAGKDSASIACALMESGLSKNSHALTYRAKGQDESILARRIARKLNLSHEIVDIDSYKVRPDKIESFFSAQLVPSLDLCSTVYLHCGLDRYKGSALIDGMGNDLFIGHIPSRKELRIATLQGFVPYWLKNHIGAFRSINQIFMIGSKTRAEMVGMWSFLSGSPLVDELLPYKDRREIWQSVDQQHADLDYIDTRASLRGRFIDQEKFIRKIKNTAFAYGLDLALPWTDSILAEYCHNLDDSELFDRDKLTNKILLRKYLSLKLGIDYFSEPKYTFAYEYPRFVSENIDFVSDVILANKLFDSSLTKKTYSKAVKMKNYGFIYQLFLLLAWHSFSRFVTR